MGFSTPRGSRCRRVEVPGGPRHRRVGGFLRTLQGTVHELAGELSLHEFAVEDALGPHQRPKLDRYATHLFLSLTLCAST